MYRGEAYNQKVRFSAITSAISYSSKRLRYDIHIATLWKLRILNLDGIGAIPHKGLGFVALVQIKFLKKGIFWTAA
jgi:hypothetical protein